LGSICIECRNCQDWLRTDGSRELGSMLKLKVDDLTGVSETLLIPLHYR